MTPELTAWDKLAIKAILSNKDFEILEVRNYKSIKSLIFDQKEYPSIVSLINEKDWESLKTFGKTEKEGFGEYLNIIRFSSRDENKYIAMIYDSDELWQDPEILEIILLP